MKAVTTKNSESTKEVLFQKLGNTWFVFTEVEGDMVYSALPNDMDPHTTKLELYEVLEEHMQKVARAQGRRAEMAA